MAGPPGMAQKQQHDGHPSVMCICGKPCVPAPSGDYGLCAGCIDDLDNICGQVQVDEQSAEPPRVNPAHVQDQSQPGDLMPMTIAADIERLREDVAQYNRDYEVLERRVMDLRRRDEELKRHQCMLMSWPQQYAAPSAHTVRGLPPTTMRVADFSVSNQNQPITYTNSNINSNLAAAKYGSAVRNANPIDQRMCTQGSVEAHYKGAPMVRRDSFSPLRNRVTPHNSSHIRRQIEQNSARTTILGMPPQMKMSSNQLLAPHAQHNSMAMMWMRNAQENKVEREVYYGRRGSAGSSNCPDGMGYSSSNGSVENIPGSSPPAVFDSPPGSSAPSANTPAPAQPSLESDSAVQLAAVHSQLAHESAVHDQQEHEAYIGMRTKLPQKSGIGRLLCPDCGKNKPIVRKRNDGIHCTACFNRRKRAGKVLQTAEERAATPHVPESAPVASAYFQPSAVVHSSPRPVTIATGHSSTPKGQPYELDYARRRAAEAAGSHTQSTKPQTRYATPTPQMPLMERTYRVSAYTSSPFAGGQYQEPEPAALSGSLSHQSPAKADLGKRNQEAAFGTAGLEIERADALSQSNKKSKPSPCQLFSGLAPTSHQSIAYTPETTPGKVNHVSHSASTTNSGSQSVLPQLDGLYDHSTALTQNAMTAPHPDATQLKTPEKAYGIAADYLQMSAGSSGSGRSLEELEGFLARELPRAIAQMSPGSSSIAGQGAEQNPLCVQV